MHVLEGFYGKPWSLIERLDMLDFLARNRFAGYCYAPKSDKKLRGDILTPYSKPELDTIRAVAERAQDKGLIFTIGLSPINLLGESSLGAWEKKCKQLLSLPGAVFAIFFDDIALNDPDIAHKQLDFIAQSNEFLEERLRLFCPTYYSDDPILEKLFGEMPEGYFETISRLPESIGIFWTGQKVITQEYDCHSLGLINEKFKRKVTIWDNAFVNDGRKTSPYLPIGNIANYADISHSVNEIFINPMNQPALAQINLLMAKDGISIDESLNRIVPELRESIINYLLEFTEAGLDGLTIDTKQSMISVFSASQHPVAENILAWLNGDYVFDPACLT
jgi:hypothetical protein